MPGNYAHYRFGQAILPTLPQEIRRTVGRFRQRFDMGLHGPDILFYHDLLLKSTVSRQGHKLHNQTGKSFFERACRAVRMNPTEAARAYLYGLLAHYALDSLCHPYIKRTVEAGSGSHREIETEFDRYLLELDGKSPAHRYDQSVHMQLTPGECETAALFFPNVSAGAIRRSVKNMAACTRILALPRGSRIWNNQESQQMAATGTDTSRIEALLERNVQLLESIGGEFSGLRVRRRMA